MIVEHACAQCPDQTSARHMFCEHMQTASCLVKAPASHTVSEHKGTGRHAERRNKECACKLCSCCELIDNDMAALCNKARASGERLDEANSILEPWHINLRTTRKQFSAPPNVSSKKQKKSTEAATQTAWSSHLSCWGTRIG